MEGFGFRKLDNDDDLIMDDEPAVFTVLPSYHTRNLDNVREIHGSDDINAAASLPSVRQRLPHTEQSGTGL